MTKKEKGVLRAVDVYSGIGGWALGLQMAGIEIVASYELWGAASETNFKNNRHQAQTIDIRRLSLADLPRDIDFVVGSPPCTEFSYSNRGGGGDVEDGLKDIVRFLTIVDHIKPTFWAMENVPRVARILEKELRPKGSLSKFAHLGIEHRVVNMEDFGIPQRRKRCIAGNLDFDLLASYSKATRRQTLGDVVRALDARRIKDPIYGVAVPKADLRDHLAEEFLTEEEERINRCGKMMHPVYNTMAFPDSLARPVRTITATCTRVSRESIVIEAPQGGKFRRLTVRERASLQSFPVTFQFYGSNYSAKLKMIGNALPPLFAFYVGQAFQERPLRSLVTPANAIKKFKKPTPVSKSTPPNSARGRFPWNRRFRFAIPSLRLKSGVRCELKNTLTPGTVKWDMALVFGSSKSIHEIAVSNDRCSRLLASVPKSVADLVRTELACLSDFIANADIGRMQDVWSRRGPGGIRPFMLLDEIDQYAAKVVLLLNDHREAAETVVQDAIRAEFGRKVSKLAGVNKLSKHAPIIAAGLMITSVVNHALLKHGVQVRPDLRHRRTLQKPRALSR